MQEQPNSIPLEWLSNAEAARRLGTSGYRVRQLAILGKIRTLADPGMTIKFSAEDVEKMIAERMKGST